MDELWIKEFQIWASATPLTFFKNSCYDYVIWQNKAIQYYIAARSLYSQELISPAAFCAFQAVENLMKATIMFYKGVSIAEAQGHSLKKMERIINNQIIRKISKKKKTGKEIVVPEYFVWENRFQSLSRYPRKGKGIGFGGFVMKDLDHLILVLIEIVPFQFGTLLFNTICRKSNPGHQAILEQDNECIQSLKNYLISRLDSESADETIYKLHRV